MYVELKFLAIYNVDCLILNYQLETFVFMEGGWGVGGFSLHVCFVGVL